jgi:small subunit ribosomal protein S6
VHKAHYVLMNIEADQETMGELEHAFKFNDAVLRHLVIKMDKPVLTPSPMMKEEKSRSLNTQGPQADAPLAAPVEQTEAAAG